MNKLYLIEICFLIEQIIFFTSFDCDHVEKKVFCDAKQEAVDFQIKKAPLVETA